ncbi:Adenylosuccinate lyase [Aphelenchoides besseyi]|nr:Adenylosuccinate lyase [Aphelenchoides besseyi]KAI6207936.1 Adenylosuccinate lyase [Aphelenchoides besseyi]
MSKEDKYESPLTSRYEKSSPLLRIFSERAKTETWRQLWIWLAEAQRELGLEMVTGEMISELKENKSNIDWDFVKAEEARIKHDVMAHNHAYGKVCPKAAGIVHLGATSCYVQDNADLIRQRDAIDFTLKKYALVMDRLATFAEKQIEVVTVGRTHWQTASLTTVGKRAVSWLQDMLIPFMQLQRFRNEDMRFRGIKGATGTQDSFLTLFKGDDNKVQELDDLVTKKAGFKRHFNITGQTYPRIQDYLLLSPLSAFGAVAQKIGKDIRFLQSHAEIMEPFEKHQIGSSAMPYKQNPMKSERVCSLARDLMTTASKALATVADQGLERTLDDSAIRRSNIPDSFLLADAILTILQNVFEGLSVPKTKVTEKVNRELPFLAFEKAMMLLTLKGANRQEAHAKIQQITHKFKEIQDRDEKAVIELSAALEDSYFDEVRNDVLEAAKNSLNFTGSCVRQVRDFLRDEFRPAVRPYLDDKSGSQLSHLDV